MYFSLCTFFSHALLQLKKGPQGVGVFFCIVFYSKSQALSVPSVRFERNTISMYPSVPASFVRSTRFGYVTPVAWLEPMLTLFPTQSSFVNPS